MKHLPPTKLQKTWNQNIQVFIVVWARLTISKETGKKLLLHIKKPSNWLQNVPILIANS